jgi:hypothetical protein
MILPVLIILNLPCRVAPIIESNNAAINPEIIIPNMMVFEVLGKRMLAVRPIIDAPRKEPIVPILVIPPDSPCLILFSVIIDTGFTFESLPNSVPQVSDIAADIEAENKKKFKELGEKWS